MAPLLNIEIVPVSEVPRHDLLVLEPAPPVVLVVDDEPVVADTLATILSQAGYETMAAYSPKIALKLAAQTPPAFLISDVLMPEMNGVELAIKLVAEVPGCRVLLFSGHASTEDLKEARAAGHDFPLLAKPVHPAEIIQYLSRHLGGAAKPVKRTRLVSPEPIQGIYASA